jgi:uncharacterized membrane protein
MELWDIGHITAGPVAVFCAPTESTFNPAIKIETARMAISRVLCRVFIILFPPDWWQIAMIRKQRDHK